MAIESTEGFLFEPLITETQKIINAVGYLTLRGDPENQMAENNWVCSFFKVDRSLVFGGVRSLKRKRRLPRGYPHYHLTIDWGNLSLGRFPQVDLHVDFSPSDILGGSRKDIQRELQNLVTSLEELSGSYQAELVSDLKVAVQL